MLEAETQFRKVIGYSDLAKLAHPVERDLAARHITTHPTTPEENAPTPITPCNHHTPTATTNSHSKRDNPRISRAPDKSTGAVAHASVRTPNMSYPRADTRPPLTDGAG
jgi:hypothetical protein